MKKNIVMQNELVQVKGRVKAITIKKEDFYNFLKLTKLRILDKTYDALMPSVDDMKKNTIDLNGLGIVMQNYLSLILYATGNTTPSTPAQIILSTSSGTSAILRYSGEISSNSQGVTVLPQIFGASGNLTFQFYFIGFDTTNSSYSATEAELYASALVNVPTFNAQGVCVGSINSTQLARIAYTNISISKSSTEYLFLVWLIEFENVPSYAPFSVPIFANQLNVAPVSLYQPCYLSSQSSTTIYFYNGSCTFSCGGNCPHGGLNSFSIFPQNNALVVQFPLQAPLQGGISNPEILICTTLGYGTPGSNSVATIISGNISTTITPPVSGATIYLAIVTISITYSVS